MKPRDNAKSAEGWFQSDAAVRVFALMVEPVDGMKLLLWSTINESAALFPAADFEVMDGEIPDAWRAMSGADGYLELSPAEWQSPDFWERYHDADPDAVALFESVAQEL